MMSMEEEMDISQVQEGSTRLTIDSGAVESVAPPSFAPAYGVRSSAGSRAGTRYRGAGGNSIPNLGEKKIGVTTEEGQKAAMTFQIAQVTKPLVAVSKVCDKDNVVCFTRDGGMIKNTITGKSIPIQRVGGTHVMDVKLQNPNYSNENEGGARSSDSAFGRPR